MALHSSVPPKSSPAKTPLFRAAIAWTVAHLWFTPIAVAIPTIAVYQNWSKSMTLRREWTVTGPACPVVPDPSPVATRRHKPPRSFTYGEATLTRSFGAVTCGAVPENPWWPVQSYRVCRFNNPGAIVVVTPTQRVVFEPTPGMPATVTLRRGVPSCVVAGDFTP